MTEGWGRLSFQTLTNNANVLYAKRSGSGAARMRASRGRRSTRSAIGMVRYLDRLRENLGESHSVATGAGIASWLIPRRVARFLTSTLSASIHGCPPAWKVGRSPLFGWRKRIIGCSRRVFVPVDWPSSSLWLAVNFLFPATRKLLLVCLASLLGLVISLHVDR